MNRTSTIAQPSRRGLPHHMADPRFDRLRNRRSRRRISVAHALLTLLFLAVLALPTGVELSTGAVLLAVVPTTLVWMVVMGMLNASINGMTELKSRDLDELQRQVRDDAYRRAYRVAIVLVAVLGAALVFGWFADTTVLTVFIGYAAFFTVLCLPGHLLAWTLPDEG